MPYDGTYRVGTATFTPGSAIVTGQGTLWASPGNATGGDRIDNGVGTPRIESVQANGQLTLSLPWGGPLLTAVAYVIEHTALSRNPASVQAAEVAAIAAVLRQAGVIYKVPAGGAPDNNLGEDGQYAFDITNLKLWERLGGIYVGPIILNSTVAANADYLVKTAHAGLSAERVVTDTPTIYWDWATAGQAKAVAAGGATARQNAGLAYSGTVVGRFAMFSDTTGAQIQTSALREIGGNVGVGVDPGATNVAILVGTNNGILLRNAAGTYQVQIHNANDDALLFGTLGNHNIYFRSANAHRGILSGGGNWHFGGTVAPYKVTMTGSSQPYNGLPIAAITTGTGTSTDEALYFGVHDGDYSWMQAVKPGTGYRDLWAQPLGGRFFVGVSPPYIALNSVSGNFTANNGIGSVLNGTNSGGSIFSIVQPGVGAWGLGMMAGQGRFSLIQNRFPGNAGTELVRVCTQIAS